jgi:hypothetical protein
MNPVEYANLYWNLKVNVGPNHSVKVPVTRYQSGKEASPGKDPLYSKLKQFFHEKKKADPNWIWHPDIPRDLFPWVGQFGFFNIDQMIHGLVRAYCGKGTPEWLSFAMHCAVKFKLTTPESLPAYAATNLGIDCSGFVGNYILHGFLPLHGFYMQSKSGQTSRGPSSLITALACPPYLKRMDEFQTSSTYVLGMIAKDGHMPAGNGDTGHVMVTVPNSNKPSPAFVGSHKTGPDSYTVSVVESRGKVGLGEPSDYTFLSVDKDSNFLVYRGGSKSTMRVKVTKLV